jgi:hypothetical protein
VKIIKVKAIVAVLSIAVFLVFSQGAITGVSADQGDRDNGHRKSAVTATADGQEGITPAAAAAGAHGGATVDGGVSAGTVIAGVLIAGGLAALIAGAIGGNGTTSQHVKPKPQ